MSEASTGVEVSGSLPSAFGPEARALLRLTLELSCPAEAGNSPLLYGLMAGETRCS